MVSSASYDSKNKDFTFGFCDGIFFKPDGTKVFIVESGALTVKQFTLSTPWDISTATSPQSQAFGITSLQGLFFNPDGTKMYLADAFSTLIKRYSLSSAWDVRTATADITDTMSVATQTTNPTSIFINSNGTKLYVATQNAGVGKVYQYTLSTAWSLSGGSYASKSLTTTTQEPGTNGLFIRPDGTKLYIVGDSSDKVWRYTMSTPEDISTATSDSDSFSVATQESDARSIFFKPDGTKFYVSGYTYKGYQYSSGESWSTSPAITSGMLLCF